MKEDGKYTLSIGDGGNDVPMIQAASVGVGLRGREGMQVMVIVAILICMLVFVVGGLSI